MTKNFLDDLWELIESTGKKPEDYMIEHSLFFHPDVVDNVFT